MMYRPSMPSMIMETILAGEWERGVSGVGTVLDGDGWCVSGVGAVLDGDGGNGVLAE